MRPRSLDLVALGLCVVAIVAVIAPWHEVRNGHLGEALGCAFMPDCHVTPPSRAAILAGPPDAVHSGLDHGGPFYLAGIVGYAALRLRAMTRASRAQTTVLAIGALLLAGAFGGEAALGGLAHLFDVTQERWGHTLVHLLGPAFLVLAVIDVYRALRWPKPLPEARVVAS